MASCVGSFAMYYDEMQVRILRIRGATTHTINIFQQTIRKESHYRGSSNINIGGELGKRKRGHTTCSHFRQWVQNNASEKRGNEGEEIRRGNSDGVFAETPGESCQNCSSDRRHILDVEVHERCRIPTGNHTKCGSIRRCYEEDSSVRGDCEREA